MSNSLKKARKKVGKFIAKNPVTKGVKKTFKRNPVATVAGGTTAVVLEPIAPGIGLPIGATVTTAIIPIENCVNESIKDSKRRHKKYHHKNHKKEDYKEKYTADHESLWEQQVMDEIEDEFG